LVSQPAPPTLSQRERRAFIDLLRRVDPDIERLVTRRVNSSDYDRHLLSALYRWLPATRAALRRSLKRELDYSAEAMAKQAGTRAVSLSPIQRELLRVGLITMTDIERAEATLDEPRHELVHRLLSTVMVPAWLGVEAPVDLVLRVVNASQDFQEFIETVRATNHHVEIVRWSQEADGSLWLGARNRLEAQLLVEEALPVDDDRAARVAALLAEVRPGADRGNADEVDFAVRLLAAAAPAKGFAPIAPRNWRRLAEALEQVRDRTGVEEPRLMLREARLLREFATDSRAGVDPATAISTLEKATQVAQRAAVVAQETARHIGLQLNLNVEVQSAAGAITLQHLKQGNLQSAREAFRSERVAMRDALATQKGSFYPISVATWTAAEMVESTALDEPERQEILAELLAMYQGTSDSDFGADQAEEYLLRRGQLGQVLEDHALSDAAFERLLAIGSPAGVLRRAIEAAGWSGHGRYEDPAAGLAVLDAYEGQVPYDQACAQLRLDLWWIARAGRPTFEGRERPLPMTSMDWRRCLDFIDAIEAFGDTRRSGANLFRRALAHFHLDEFPRSMDVFGTLRNDNSVPPSRRLATIYVASTAEGRARRFSGRVNLTGRDRRPRLYVNELGHRVELDVGRFRLRGMSGAVSLEVFIGFSPQGPQAIPTSTELEDPQGS
jgi:hypothetical protein